jgi:hypothetical protein
MVLSRMEEAVFGQPTAVAVAELAEPKGTRRMPVMASATLNRDMPLGLATVGIGRDVFPRIAEAAMATPWVPYNPRRIAGPAQVMKSWRLPHQPLRGLPRSLFLPADAPGRRHFEDTPAHR